MLRDRLFFTEPGSECLANDGNDRVLVNQRECLFYWEVYYKATNKWINFSDERRTRAEIKALLDSDQGFKGYDRLEPLYHLGFRLPQKDDDESTR